MTGDDLQALARKALEEIARAADLDQLELVRRRYMARHGGLITSVAAELGGLTGDARAQIGKAFNAAKVTVGDALAERQRGLEGDGAGAGQADEWVDLSHPIHPLGRGHEHPVARTIREIEDIFAKLGYTSVAGPEIEDDLHNFQLLNMPPEHPARDAHDTFYLTGTGSGWLYRTHTSPMQMRTMLSGVPPFRIIVPGKVARRDNPDPTHNPVFHQVEGLCVDEGVTVGDLKGTLEHVARELFGADRGVRLRSSYFPYTEPSLEADVACGICKGAGCRSCHGKGWIEILGSGMVHPAVLRNAGVDPERYSGFAFGMGPDRIAALRYSLRDVRDLYENDLRLLECF
ncbi:MAG: phenylalanine--tRNA ligase subunit alpha [Candidatus Dormibacteria bacterium]